nr:basic helix-loop-helix transcription factor [Loropetalum chinense var. rubrum]
MALNEQDFLEELLALRRDTWETIPTEMNQFLSNPWNFDCFNQNPSTLIPNSSFQTVTPPPQLQHNFDHSFSEYHCPFGDDFSALHIADSVADNKLEDTPPLIMNQEDYPSSIMEADEDPALVLGDDLQNMEMQATTCKMEPTQSSNEASVFNMGVCLDSKSRVKKVQGQPSKNLMAERRRRKRLNDRLSMLRSVVPKISKMDRTSILGDTIDYMKELLERIHSLQEEMEVGSSNQLDLMNVFKDLKPNELVRNSPKPGLLLSTVTSLEALGLDIQQCVISCFNDFAMQASCSEDLEQRRIMNSEDIKQALFRNAGYGGRCL